MKMSSKRREKVEAIRTNLSFASQRHSVNMASQGAEPDVSLVVDPLPEISGLSIAVEPRLINIAGAKWESRFDAHQGRFLVATRDFSAGDVVIKELPFAFVPFDGPQAQVCYVCGKLQTVLLECKSCSEVSYCSASCRELWSPIHAELECVVHQNLSKIASSHSVDATLLKLAWRIGVFVTLQKRALTDSYRSLFRNGSGSYEDVCSLVSHMEHYTGTPWAEAIEPACAAMLALLPASTDYALTARELLEMCARINSNAHAIVPEERPKALGLFCALSQMNHSCSPNTTFAGLGTGPALYCRALRPIKTGEPLTISYIDLYQSRNDRQELLRHSKFFECTCPRCTEPLAQSIDALIVAFRCPQRACLGKLVEQDEMQIVPAEPLKTGKKRKATPTPSTTTSASNEPVKVHKCDACGEIQASSILGRKLDEAIAAYNAASELYAKGTSTSNEAAKRQYEAILAKFGAVQGNATSVTLGEDHWLLFNAAQRLTNCCVRGGDILGAIKALTRVVGSSKRILPPNEPETANYLMSLAECVIQLEGSKKLGKAAMAPYLELKSESLSAALRIRNLALGAEHLLTRQTRELLRK